MKNFKSEPSRKDLTNAWIPNKLSSRVAQSERQESRGSLYSRHLNHQRQKDKPVDLEKQQNTLSKIPENVDKKWKRNLIAPFSSSGKATCGYFFSRNTDHRKRKIGIPPSNLVQWRSHLS